MSVPTYSNVALQSQVVAAKPLTCPDFYLSDTMVSKLHCVRHAIYMVKTSDGKTASIVEVENVSWWYTAKTYAVYRFNGMTYTITMEG